MSQLPHANHHVHPISLYVKTYLALLFFMVLTIGFGEFAIPNIGPINGTLLNNLVAMAIAVIKASIVMSIFMGLWYSSGLVKIYALIGFVWATLMTVMFCDYATRQYEPNPSWEKVQDSSLPRYRIPMQPYQEHPQLEPSEK